MPTATIPLVGQLTQRNYATVSSYNKDQSFRGVIPTVLRNPITGQTSIALEKRTAFTRNISGAGSVVGTAILGGTAAFGGTTSTIWNSVNCGTVTTNHIVRHISLTVIGGVTFYLFSARNTISGATSGWFLADDASSQTSYTGTLTSGSAVVPSIASTAGMYAGQAITGTGIPASTTILTVDSATQITMSAVATANGAQTIAKTPLAKIIDANFPSSITGQFVELDGYVFIMDTNGKIWNSNLNTVQVWSATGFKSADTYSDAGVGLAKIGHRICAFGANSAEFFYNAGYATGSPLEKTKEVLEVGAKAYLVAGYGIVAISDSCGIICWIDSDANVYMYAGGAKMISTPPVKAFTGAASVYGISAFRFWGHTVISIPFSSSIGDNLFYFVDLGIWMVAGLTSSAIIDGSSTAAAPAGVSPDGANGFFYTLSSNTYFEISSAAVTSVIQTQRINHGTDNRKFVSDISLLADEQSSGTVTLECSDDDYGSWVTLGTFDLTLHKKKIVRCGSYRGGRAYRLTHSTNAAFRMEALQINYTVGTN